MKKRKYRSKDGNLRGRQLRMAILFAEMKSAQEVADVITEEFNITESRDNCYAFSRTIRGKKLIKFIHNKFITSLMKIPIANKAVRLQRYERIYKESMTESLKSRTQFGDIYELKLGAAAEALEKARVEMEGDKGVVLDNSQHTHFYLPVKDSAPNLLNRIHDGIKS